MALYKLDYYYCYCYYYYYYHYLQNSSLCHKLIRILDEDTKITRERVADIQLFSSKLRRLIWNVAVKSLWIIIRVIKDNCVIDPTHNTAHQYSIIIIIIISAVTVIEIKIAILINDRTEPKSKSCTVTKRFL